MCDILGKKDRDQTAHITLLESDNRRLRNDLIKRERTLELIKSRLGPKEFLKARTIN